MPTARKLAQAVLRSSTSDGLRSSDAAAAPDKALLKRETCREADPEQRSVQCQVSYASDFRSTEHGDARQLAVANIREGTRQHGRADA